MNKLIKQLRTETQKELETNILPFWMDRMLDKERGGFFWWEDGEGHLEGKGSQGEIFKARIFWELSCAFRIMKKGE